MALTTALLLFAALPESGAVAQSRATAHIVAAEEIDFGHMDAGSGEAGALFRLITRNDDTGGHDDEAPLQLVEFQ